MIIRPVDGSGDVLPVLTSSALLRGDPAEKVLIDDRLELLSGDWWENPGWGNAVVELLKENRYTEADQQTLATYLTSYIRETPGVRDVRDVSFSTEGKQFAFACTVETDSGSFGIHYEL